MWSPMTIAWTVLAAAVTTTRAQAVGDALSSSLLAKFESEWPIGDPRRCQELSRLSKLDVKRFEVLPGIGWDNLRNKESGQVVSFNYTKCKLTDDGTLLIPDNVFTVPLKTSSVQSFAELIDSWHNTSSTTSNTVNIQAGLTLPSFGISGKFSYEHDELKSKMIEDKAVTTRVQLRYYRYEAKLQPDPSFSPEFKRRLMSIAANIELNRTEQAMYEGQLLVRDFGTHVLTSLTAGAGLSKDDYLKRDYVESHTEDKTAILASASASFFNVFKMSASYGHSTDQKVSDMYNKMMTRSFIKTHGGPMFEASNMTMHEWIRAVDENLVPMDRVGDPLYFLITTQALPELPAVTVSEVEKVVRQSIELYYEMNVISGCTKLGSPNFSFSANFDDGSCHSKPTNLTFGGVYQLCSVSGQYLQNNPCAGLAQQNPKTGGFSCPPSYTPVQLHVSRRNGHTEDRRTCKRCGFFHLSHCCHTDQFYSSALVTTFWCAATGPVQPHSGYLFGGLFTPKTPNLVTGTQGCPKSFYPRKLFTDLSVCISDDYEFGEAFSVPFGGFFSCDTGNPLAQDDVRPVGANGVLREEPPNSLRSFMADNHSPQSWPQGCPQGYSQHLAFDDLGCHVHYCVLTGALSIPALPPVKRPPFMTKPVTLIEDADNLVMFDINSQEWHKDDDAKETLKASTIMIPSKPRSGESGAALSLGATVAISVFTTLVCAVLAAVVIIAVRRRQSRRRGAYRRLTEESREPQSSYGSTDPEDVVTS